MKAPVLVCPVCKTVQPDLTDGVDSLSLAYVVYRRKHGLLTPQRIREIREQYGLSHEAFATVLGMSPATLYRYEGGALQDEVNDSLIYACDDPGTMGKLVSRRADRLSQLQKKRFEASVSKKRSA